MTKALKRMQSPVVDDLNAGTSSQSTQIPSLSSSSSSSLFSAQTLLSSPLTLLTRLSNAGAGPSVSPSLPLSLFLSLLMLTEWLSSSSTVDTAAAASVVIKPWTSATWCPIPSFDLFLLHQLALLKKKTIYTGTTVLFVFFLRLLLRLPLLLHCENLFPFCIAFRCRTDRQTDSFICIID